MPQTGSRSGRCGLWALQVWRTRRGARLADVASFSGVDPAEIEFEDRSFDAVSIIPPTPLPVTTAHTATRNSRWLADSRAGPD